MGDVRYIDPRRTRLGRQVFLPSTVAVVRVRRAPSSKQQPSKAIPRNPLICLAEQADRRWFCLMQREARITEDMTPEQAEQRVKDSANVLKNNGVELKSHSHDGTVFRYAIRTETGLSRFQGTPAQHEKSFGGNFN